MAKGRDEQAGQSVCWHCRRSNGLIGRCVFYLHTDMGPAYLAACGVLLPNSQSVIDRFHVAKKLGEVADRASKKNYCGFINWGPPREQRKHLRSLMHDYRRRPEDLKPAQKLGGLDNLFEKVPMFGGVDLPSTLGSDTNLRHSRGSSGGSRRALEEWIAPEVRTMDLDWEPFITTLRNHWDGILASISMSVALPVMAPVEGINNKIRVASCVAVTASETRPPCGPAYSWTSTGPGKRWAGRSTLSAGWSQAYRPILLGVTPKNGRTRF